MATIKKRGPETSRVLYIGRNSNTYRTIQYPPEHTKRTVEVPPSCRFVDNSQGRDRSGTPKVSDGMLCYQCLGYTSTDLTYRGIVPLLCSRSVIRVRRSFLILPISIGEFIVIHTHDLKRFHESYLGIRSSSCSPFVTHQK